MKQRAPSPFLFVTDQHPKSFAEASHCSAFELCRTCRNFKDRCRDSDIKDNNNSLRVASAVNKSVGFIRKMHCTVRTFQCEWVHINTWHLQYILSLVTVCCPIHYYDYILPYTIYIHKFYLLIVVKVLNEQWHINLCGLGVAASASISPSSVLFNCVIGAWHSHITDNYSAPCWKLWHIPWCCVIQSLFSVREISDPCLFCISLHVQGWRSQIYEATWWLKIWNN